MQAGSDQFLNTTFINQKPAKVPKGPHLVRIEP